MQYIIYVHKHMYNPVEYWQNYKCEQLFKLLDISLYVQLDLKGALQSLESHMGLKGIQKHNCLNNW